MAEEFSNRASRRIVRAHGGVRRRGGFTLLEVTLAMTVLLVGMLATTASTLKMHSLRRVNRERVLAQNAVRSAAERLQSLSSRALTEPAGWTQSILNGVAAGGEIGSTFDITELAPREGEATVGTIQVLTDETRSDVNLGAVLGMPRDLDGDGAATTNVVGANALLLPVIIRARWHGASGDSQIVHAFFLSRF